jgi:peptidoglycan/xylan/chitin deacetylase (PgdA/CDA1 family)
MGLRIDRFATLYFANPLKRQETNQAGRIPILMYHSISEDPEAGIHPYYRVVTAPAVFAEHMAYLHENGYTTIDPGEVANRLTKEATTNTSKAVAITFDDGFLDFYTHAFPVLQRHNFQATVYLPTAYIGDSRICFKGKACMVWNEVRELRRHGMLFGSHTVTHPQLHDLNRWSIEEEVRQSKQTIEQNLGRTAESFAYPYAFPDADTSFRHTLQGILSDAGYQNGVCTKIGRAERGSNPLFMKRLPINSCDDPPLFEAKLVGAYDWLAGPQYLAKLAKRWVGAARHSSS